MHVHEVKIENIKNLGGPSTTVNLDLQRPDGTLSGWTVIAGRNGSGKSTLLQAIAVSLTGPEAARAVQETWAGWIRHGAPSASVSTRIRYSAGLDRFSETGRLPKESFWTGLRWDTAEAGP